MNIAIYDCYFTDILSPHEKMSAIISFEKTDKSYLYCQVSDMKFNKGGFLDEINFTYDDIDGYTYIGEYKCDDKCRYTFKEIK